MIGTNKVLGLVPARGGSKGLPGKNLKLLAGHSLVARAIEQGKLSHYIDSVVVSSDNETILMEAVRYGAIPLKRPDALAQDHSRGIDPVLHALTQYPDHSVIALLQPTSPLRTPQDIDACLEMFRSSNSGSCVSVCDVGHCHPHWMYRRDSKGKLTPFLNDIIAPARRQDLPSVFVPNGAVYVATRSFLLEKESFISEGTVGYIMPQERSIDIDSALDLAIAETWLATLKNP